MDLTRVEIMLILGAVLLGLVAMIGTYFNPRFVYDWPLDILFTPLFAWGIFKNIKERNG